MDFAASVLIESSTSVVTISRLAVKPQPAGYRRQQTSDRMPTDGKKHQRSSGGAITSAHRKRYG